MTILVALPRMAGDKTLDSKIDEDVVHPFRRLVHSCAKRREVDDIQQRINEH